MSFLRPEVRSFFWRWREVAGTAAVTLWGVHLIGRAWGRESLGIGLFGVGITIIFAGLLFLAILRVRLNPVGQAAGVVEVDEREIGYLGPEGGAFLSINDLTRIEVADRHWVLNHLGGPALIIPASAEGADQLFDAFAALPGLRIEDAVRAMGSDGRQLVWTRATT